MFNDLEKGTTIKFYSNWNDNYMIGDIVEKKDNGYKVSIKSRIAKEIFVEKNDISNVIDKTIKFEPIDEEVIEIPIIEESFEIPLIEDIVVEEPIEEEPIVEEPIIEEHVVEEPVIETGLHSNSNETFELVLNINEENSKQSLESTILGTQNVHNIEENLTNDNKLLKTTISKIMLLKRFRK